MRPLKRIDHFISFSLHEHSWKSTCAYDKCTLTSLQNKSDATLIYHILPKLLWTPEQVLVEDPDYRRIYCKIQWILVGLLRQTQSRLQNCLRTLPEVVFYCSVFQHQHICLQLAVALHMDLNKSQESFLRWFCQSRNPRVTIEREIMISPMKSGSNRSRDPTRGPRALREPCTCQNTMVCTMINHVACQNGRNWQRTDPFVVPLCVPKEV